MKKGYIVAAMVWLTALAAIAVLGTVLRPDRYHITWSLTELLDPFKLLIVGLPFIALVLLSGALLFIQRRPRAAETLLRIGFAILFALSLTGIVSIFGLLMAPAAWFAYMATWEIKKPKAV